MGTGSTTRGSANERARSASKADLCGSRCTEADAIVFSGGIGEHAPVVRTRICEGLEWCGLILDPDRNAATVGAEGRITADDARLHAYVVPVDEELLIAADTIRCIEG